MDCGLCHWSDSIKSPIDPDITTVDYPSGRWSKSWVYSETNVPIARSWLGSRHVLHRSGQKLQRTICATISRWFLRVSKPTQLFWMCIIDHD